MELKVLLSLFIMTFGSAFSSVTVEEGGAAILQCPGFTPTPGGGQSAVFYWYKAREGDVHNDNRVAFLAKRDGVVSSERDLAGRATIDSTTGALQITHTRVSDDHVYTCLFPFTSMGGIKNETNLTITVTPSEQDLQVTANPPGPVPVGGSVTFTCSASRVRPPPQVMYWQYTDEAQNFGDHKSVTNSAGLTSSVSVQYSLRVNRSHHGRKLACHYVSSTRNISSKEITIQVLSKPIGKPSLKSNRIVVKVNSKVDLICNSSQVSGSATWFAWQFMNGTLLGNTTQPTWTYDVKEKEETLQFVCIAGNWLGQSDTSEPLSINVQSLGNNDLGLIIGLVIGASLVLGFIITGIVYKFIRHRKVDDENHVEYENEGAVPPPLHKAKRNETGHDYENGRVKAKALQMAERNETGHDYENGRVKAKVDGVNRQSVESEIYDYMPVSDSSYEALGKTGRQEAVDMGSSSSTYTSLTSP